MIGVNRNTEDSVTTSTSEELSTSMDTNNSQTMTAATGAAVGTGTGTGAGAAPTARAGARPSSGSWTSPAHNEQRKTVIKAILRLLLERRPYADAQWRERIARMAKKLEARLYFTSASLEEHLDMATLRCRLQRVATEVIAARRPTTTTGANAMVTAEDVAETENLLSSFVPTPSTGASNGVNTNNNNNNNMGVNATHYTAINPSGRPLDPTRTTIRRFVLFRTANAA